MRNIDSVDASCGYVLTLEGLADIEDSEPCHCHDLLVYDGAYACAECGTVYGVVHGWNRFGPYSWRKRRQS